MVRADDVCILLQDEVGGMDEELQGTQSMQVTSALDSKTEEEVLASLKEVASSGKPKTTIIVAHHLKAVTHADMIFVMDSGCIAERGSHSDLMALKGVYFTLFQGQEAETHLHGAQTQVHEEADESFLTDIVQYLRGDQTKD
jgi:ABC-type multidrug transport system ATPase subunit